jgi:hypothetical protein
MVAVGVLVEQQVLARTARGKGGAARSGARTRVARPLITSRQVQQRGASSYCPPSGDVRQSSASCESWLCLRSAGLIESHAVSDGRLKGIGVDV